MSAVPDDRRDGAAEVVAGFLATLAMVGGAIATVERPVVIGVAAIVISFVAAAMADRNRRLAAVGVAFASIGFFIGMTVSVLGSRPLW